MNGARPVFLGQRGCQWATHSEWGFLVSSRTEGEGAYYVGYQTPRVSPPHPLGIHATISCLALCIISHIVVYREITMVSSEPRVHQKPAH